MGPGGAIGPYRGCRARWGYRASEGFWGLRGAMEPESGARGEGLRAQGGAMGP